MNRRNLIGLAFIVSILVGCATFETNAYRTIGVTAHTVDSLMVTWADESVAGRTTAQLDASVVAAHATYQKSMAAAKVAVDAYRAGRGSQDAVVAVMGELSRNKEVLRKLILSLVLTPSQTTSIQKLP